MNNDASSEIPDTAERPFSAPFYKASPAALPKLVAMFLPASAKNLPMFLEGWPERSSLVLSSLKLLIFSNAFLVVN